MQKRIHYAVYIQLAVLTAAFFLLYGEIIMKLVQDWSVDDNYSHGFLIPFIAGYMVWQKKEKLARYRPVPSKWGLLVMGMGILLFIVGNIGAELFTMRFSIVVMIFGTVWYLFGFQILREVTIPILYLIFMIPLPSIIWNKIAFPLQLLAARLTADVVQMIGIPVLREGNVLHLANTSLEVVDACSGLRSLTSLLALSGAFAYMVSLNIINRWILFFSAIPIAVVVNIIRLTVTAIMARWMGEAAAQGFLHDMSGIIVFVFAFLLLGAMWGVLNRFEQKKESEQQ